MRLVARSFLGIQITGTVNLTYDLGNRIKNLTGTVAKIYGYDKLDRLVTYSNEIYGYDGNGNRSSHTVGATNYLYTYPATSNRLSTMAGPTARTFTSDASGNVTNISTGYAFNYGARGRMTNITAGSVNQYGINGLGQRLTKAGTGYTGTQRFVYGEDGKLLGEYDNTGALITEHVYLNDTPIAAIKTAGAYLIQADHLNTPRAILGASNALVWKWDSDAFGTTAANENPSALGTFNYNPRFPGQYYDKESTGHYNYFRDLFFAKTGRYLQSDPIGLKGGINTFAYVHDDPVNFSDRKGLQGMQPAVRPPVYPQSRPSQQELFDNFGNLDKNLQGLFEDFGTMRSVCRVSSCSPATPIPTASRQCSESSGPFGPPPPLRDGPVVSTPGNSGCICLSWGIEVAK